MNRMCKKTAFCLLLIPLITNQFWTTDEAGISNCSAAFYHVKDIAGGKAKWYRPILSDLGSQAGSVLKRKIAKEDSAEQSNDKPSLPLACLESPLDEVTTSQL